jgi:hypothetical protein
MAVAGVTGAEEKARVRGAGEVSTRLFEMNGIGGLNDDDAMRHERSDLTPYGGNRGEQREGRQNKAGAEIVHRPRSRPNLTCRHARTWGSRLVTIVSLWQVVNKNVDVQNFRRATGATWSARLTVEEGSVG